MCSAKRQSNYECFYFHYNKGKNRLIVDDNQIDAMTRRKARTLALLWILAAIFGSIGVSTLMNGAFPFFTLLWLIPSLTALLLGQGAQRLGMGPIPRREYVRTTLILLVGFALLMVAFEPWSHTYRMLVSLAVSSTPPDTTFGWLVWFPGLPGYAGMLLYSGLVTIFAEEVFFHGWLLQALLRIMRPVWAVLLAAALLTLPQAILVLVLPPLQGGLYIVVYSFLEIGVIGGWSAARTRSIWPVLTAAVLTNFMLTLLVY